MEIKQEKPLRSISNRLKFIFISVIFFKFLFQNALTEMQVGIFCKFICRLCSYFTLSCNFLMVSVGVCWLLMLMTEYDSSYLEKMRKAMYVTKFFYAVHFVGFYTVFLTYYKRDFRCLLLKFTLITFFAFVTATICVLTILTVKRIWR